MIHLIQVILYLITLLEKLHGFTSVLLRACRAAHTEQLTQETETPKPTAAHPLPSRAGNQGCDHTIH